MNARVLILTVLTVLVSFAPEASARILDSELGRWTRRDPLGYVDGMGMYGYGKGRAVSRQDPTGLRSLNVSGACAATDSCGGGVDPPCDQTECCRQAKSYFEAQSGGRGPLVAAVCCNGAKSVCVFTGHPQWPTDPSISTHWESCANTCEPLHFPNMTCATAPANSCFWPPDPHPQAPLSNPCSEYVVNNCFYLCVLAHCCGRTDDCCACNGNPTCIQAMKTKLEQRAAEVERFRRLCLGLPNDPQGPKGGCQSASDFTSQCAVLRR